MKAITNANNLGEGGIKPEGTVEITNNGTYDVTEYAEADVQVPASAVVSGTLNITTNGTHDVTEYAEANVQVPGVIDPSKFPNSFSVSAQASNSSSSGNRNTTLSCYVPVFGIYKRLVISKSSNGSSGASIYFYKNSSSVSSKTVAYNTTSATIPIPDGCDYVYISGLNASGASSTVNSPSVSAYFYKT